MMKSKIGHKKMVLVRYRGLSEKEKIRKENTQEADTGICLKKTYKN